MGSGASQVSLETEQHKPLDASDVDCGDGGVAAIKEVQRLRKLLAANHGLVQKLLLNAAVDDIADACDGEAAPASEGPAGAGSAVADLDEAEAEEKSDGAPASPGAKDDKAACDAAVREYVARQRDERMHGGADLDAELEREMSSAPTRPTSAKLDATLPESKTGPDDDDDWEEDAHILSVSLYTRAGETRRAYSIGCRRAGEPRRALSRALDPLPRRRRRPARRRGRARGRPPRTSTGSAAAPARASLSAGGVRRRVVRVTEVAAHAHDGR